MNAAVNLVLMVNLWKYAIAPEDTIEWGLKL